MGSKGSVEIPRSSPRVVRCVGWGAEESSAFAAPSRNGNGVAVNHVLECPVCHRRSLVSQEGSWGLHSSNKVKASFVQWWYIT